MKQVSIRLAGLFIMLIPVCSALAQCDTLLTEAAVRNDQGSPLNEQSLIKYLPSADDLELSVVLSGGRIYTFELIGHRDFEVFIRKAVNGTENKGANRSEKLIITSSKEEKDGVFSIKAEKTHELIIRFEGIEKEEGSECVGALIYAAEL